MDRRDEASRILEAIMAGRFALRDHAIRRTDERILSRENVVHAAKTLLSWKYQDDKFSHWFIGYLDESRTGGFAAIVDDEVRVLTVFKRRLSRREREAFAGYPVPASLVATPSADSPAASSADSPAASPIPK